MGILLAMLLAFQGAPSAPPQPDQAADKCSLSGTVVDSVTGQPVGKAALELFSLSSNTRNSSVSSTDANGNFSLADLQPGQYRLLADRSGYARAFYSVRGSVENGSVIRLEAGQTLKDLRFRLTPAGTVAGTIRDSDGEPIEGASVELGRIRYDDRGRLHAEFWEPARSDDRGDYRFHGLAPGKYYVRALDPRLMRYDVVDRSAGKRPEDREVLTYYPGAPDSSTASAVEVLAGKHVEGIDIRMLKAHAVCIGGRMTTAGQANHPKVVIEAEGFSASTSPEGVNGDFRICGVPSGTYVVSGYLDGASTRQSLNVGQDDVNDIRLTPEPAIPIHGHVGVEGQQKVDLSNFYVMIDRDGKNVGLISGLEENGGAFTITRLGMGNYDFSTEFLPRGLYVKSMRSGTTDVLADGLTVSGAEVPPVEITLSQDGATAGGVVVDKDQQPVPGATVLIVPVQRSRHDLFANTTTDQRGRYEFDSLTPGSYSLFAFEDVEANAWNDPDFLRGYEKQGVKAELEAKGKAVIDLRIAVPPDGQ